MEPTKLLRDSQGDALCPKCGEKLRFVEGQPVRVVNGQLNMRDTEDHYVCASCHGSYRKLLSTDYYQWYED